MSGRTCGRAVLAAGLLFSSFSIARPPDPLAHAHEHARAGRRAEAIAAFREYVEHNRFDGGGWAALSFALHMNQQFPEAIDAAKRAIDLGVNPAGQMYNIACGYALMGEKDMALDWLRRSFDAGFPDSETVELDSDMDSLRDDPRFIELTGLNPPQGLTREERWAWDLDFLVRRMEQMHWDLYANVSEETFRGEIERLKKEAPSLTDERIRARLMRIVTMVGDGHTGLASFAAGEEAINRYPLHLRAFTDGIFVIGAPPAQKHLVGAKVQRVGRLSASEALEAVAPYCHRDNDMGVLSAGPIRLAQPAVLQDAGVIEGSEALYVFTMPDGSRTAETLKPEPLAMSTLNHRLYRNGWVYGNSEGAAPRYLRNLETPLWSEYLADEKLMYVSFNAVAENPDQSFRAFVDELEADLRETGAERLVLDMRLNGGGNTGLVLPLIHMLIRNDTVNRPGRLYVIIGRDTFSAAQNTVNLIEMHTNATFVGEPTGSRPAFVGESTWVRMPYSGVRVYCSSRYWQLMDSTDKRTWVQPQIAVEMTYAQWAANQDPCMDAVLARVRGERKRESVTTATPAR